MYAVSFREDGKEVKEYFDDYKEARDAFIELSYTHSDISLWDEDNKVV